MWPAFQERVRESRDGLALDRLGEDLRRVWEMHFPIRERLELASWLGALVAELGWCEEALRYFQQSFEHEGASATTACNIAICHHNLGRVEKAREWVERALEIDPVSEAAGVLRVRLGIIARTGLAAEPLAGICELPGP